MRRATILGALVLVVLLAGCVEDAVLVEPPPMAGSLAVDPGALELDPLRPPEHASTIIARHVPGFGGYYIQDGVVHAVLTDWTRVDQSLGMIRAFVFSGPEAGRALDLSSTVVAVPGEFTFAELKTWRDGLIEPLFAIAGVTMVGVDQRANRILVGVPRLESQ